MPVTRRDFLAATGATLASGAMPVWALIGAGPSAAADPGGDCAGTRAPRVPLVLAPTWGPEVPMSALHRAGAASTPLAVAYAGSMTAVMEQAIGPAAARALGIALRGRAQGANALAREITGGSLRPDVFLAVTAEPMEIVLRARMARAAAAIARTEMVIAYAPRGRFAAALARGEAWWRILESPGIRFGRTDPETDPQGRNIIYVCELAERYFHQPGLAARILGPTINPRQIFSEAMVEGRLQSGELDAASAYRTQPGPFHLPYVTLPAAINLSGARPGADHGIALSLGGRTYRPQPLIFYAAALTTAAHAAAAHAFVRWLRGARAQALLRHYGYDDPGGAAPLTGADA